MFPAPYRPHPDAGRAVILGLLLLWISVLGSFCCAALCSPTGIRPAGLSVNRNCLSPFHVEKRHSCTKNRCQELVEVNCPERVKRRLLLTALRFEAVRLGNFFPNSVGRFLRISC